MGEPHQPRPTRITSATSLALVIGLSACSQVPALKVPEVPVAAAWHEPSPSVAAEPRRVLPSDAWWTIYGDSELDTLQQRLLADSPDLAAALARYQQARAASDLLRASQSPTLGGSLNLQRNRQSERRPLRVLGPNSPDYYNSATLGLELEYEVDVWGRVRALVAGGEAQRLAAQADLAGARLSLQASLAETLIVLRGLDRDVELLGEAQTAYARALDLVRRRHEGGASSGLDLARAQAQLEATRSQQRQSLAQRALVEHAIAALLGQSPSEFTIAPRSTALQTAMSETGRARSGTPQTGTPQTGTEERIGNGAVGNGAVGKGTVGNGAVGNGAVGDGAVGSVALAGGACDAFVRIARTGLALRAGRGAVDPAAASARYRGGPAARGGRQRQRRRRTERLVSVAHLEFAGWLSEQRLRAFPWRAQSVLGDWLDAAGQCVGRRPTSSR